MSRPNHLVAETTHVRIAKAESHFSVRWPQQGSVLPCYMAVSAAALAAIAVASWAAGVPMPEWRTW